jgi:hypothetical protein
MRAKCNIIKLIWVYSILFEKMPCQQTQKGPATNSTTASLPSLASDASGFRIRHKIEGMLAKGI